MKKNITITILVIIIALLLVGTIYISWTLTKESNSTRVAAKQTKAASITYSKTIDLQTATPTETTASPTAEVTTQPTVEPTAGADKTASTVSPTSAVSANTETAPGVTISPTEVLLAQDTSVIASADGSITSTPVQQQNELPSTGWVSWTLPIFVAASLFIVLSFLY